ncbi:hypothetical protein, partial [Clostridium neonatale]
MNYIYIVCDGKEIIINSNDTAEAFQDFILKARYSDICFINGISDSGNRRIMINPKKVSLIMDVTQEVKRTTKSVKPIKVKSEVNIIDGVIDELAKKIEE